MMPFPKYSSTADVIVNTVIALSLGAAVSLVDTLWGFPFWILATVSVTGNIILVVVLGVLAGRTWAQIFYRSAWWSTVTLWPIWYALSGSSLWPILALIGFAALMSLLAPAHAPVTLVDTKLPEKLPEKKVAGPFADVTVGLVDVAADMFERFGGRPAAEFVAGRELPDHDWRLKVTYQAGGSTKVATMNAAATAADVVALINQVRAEQSTP